MAGAGIKLVEFIPSIDFDLEDGDSVDLITWDEAAGYFVVNDEAVEILLELTGNIGFAMFCGESKIGKSSLLNYTMGIEQNDGFSSNRIGISFWSRPIFKPQTETNIYLVDVSGFNSNSGHLIDEKLWCMVYLMASLIIYNTKDEINEDTFYKLQHIHKLKSMVYVDVEDESNDFALSYYSPRLLWTIRDVEPQNLSYNHNIVDSENYFENQLREIPSANTANKSQGVIDFNTKVRSQIVNTFKDRECIDFPYPFKSRNSAETVPRFNQQVYKLRERILSRMTPKHLNGTNFTSRMMVSYITFIVEK